MPTLIKENYKTILAILVTIICLPLINTVVQIIFTYGTYVGTFVRNIVENGACF